MKKIESKYSSCGDDNESMVTVDAATKVGIDHIFISLTAKLKVIMICKTMAKYFCRNRSKLENNVCHKIESFINA